MSAIIAIVLLLILLTLWFGSPAVMSSLGWGAAGLAALAVIGVVLAGCATIWKDLFGLSPKDRAAAKHREQERWRKKNGLDYDKAVID